MLTADGTAAAPLSRRCAPLAAATDVSRGHAHRAAPPTRLPTEPPRAARARPDALSPPARLTWRSAARAASAACRLQQVLGGGSRPAATRLSATLGGGVAAAERYG